MRCTNVHGRAMPDSVINPFAALSLIVAPAILTNASSVLVGAVAATAAGGVGVTMLEVVALIACALAVAALVYGSLLLRETSMAVDVMRERTRLLRRDRSRAA